ncbi:hypothetical protein ACFL2D_02555 [Patescibacteria group bacterium]
MATTGAGTSSAMSFAALSTVRAIANANAIATMIVKIAALMSMIRAKVV